MFFSCYLHLYFILVVLGVAQNDIYYIRELDISRYWFIHVVILSSLSKHTLVTSLMRWCLISAYDVNVYGYGSQAPFLEDPNTGIEMFESADIIEYLRTIYALQWVMLWSF